MLPCIGDNDNQEGRMKMINRMICGVIALIGAVALTMGLTVGTASAQETGHLPVAPWAANGQSEVVDSTTVKLQDHVNGNTSVENPSVGLNVQAGAVISVEYELVDEATCESGEPRLFAFVNGHHDKSTLCESGGDPETSGVLSFEASSAGLVTQVGMVYSRDTGHVIMRNLTVDGTLVLFQAPATETPDPGATETPDPGATETPDPGATETPDPGATETPDPGATETPDPVAGELPVTSGIRTLPALLIGGFLLVGLGAGLYYATRRKVDPTR